MDDFPADIDGMLKAAEDPEPEPDPVPGLVRKLLSVKYAVLLAYVSYGDQLRGANRDGLYEHFQEHVKDERRSIYELNRHLASRGEVHVPHNVTIPEVELGGPVPLLGVLLQFEEAALEAWRELFRAIPPNKNVGLSGFAQNGAQAQLAHVEDLRRWGARS